MDADQIKTNERSTPMRIDKEPDFEILQKELQASEDVFFVSLSDQTVYVKMKNETEYIINHSFDPSYNFGVNLLDSDETEFSFNSSGDFIHAANKNIVEEIELTEDLLLPETDIILEAGDAIQVYYLNWTAERKTRVFIRPKKVD